MIHFDFSTANQIIFGSGRLKEVGPIAANMGHKALVITGEDTSRAEPLLEILSSSGIEIVLFPVANEPDIATIRRGLDAARHVQAELVIGYGGGSALDTGKAIAILATNPGDVFDYLEVIGKGKPLRHPGMPCIAVPTTAGTGSEVTRNAVIAAPDQRVKVSLRSPWMLPRLALVDPELTYSLPPGVTASTGMDALTQVIEPYVSPFSTPITDGFCLEGMHRISQSLRIVYNDGSNAEARTDMSLGSLMGGLALANSKLGAVHGLAGVLGGMYNISHGSTCARLLPIVMEVNIRALRKREPDSRALQRYIRVAAVLTGKLNAQAEDGVDWVRDLVSDLKIPYLEAYGIPESEFGEVIEKAAKASSTRGNPVHLASQEFHEILEKAL